MTFDSFEVKAMEQTFSDATEKLSALGKSFKNSLSPENGIFKKANMDADEGIAKWIGVERAEISLMYDTVRDTVSKMYNGTDRNGIHTLGLEEISSWKINPEYEAQNLKQQAGYAAEVISTAKDNLAAKAENTGITTYRADDMPELYKRNDQYVDKVRINAQGDVVERVQVKFVGNDGESCLAKLTSQKYDKYFNDGMVDKIEIPKDYYDDIRNNKLIEQKMESLNTQLDRVKELGKTDAAEKIEAKIDRLQKVDEMLEKSSVSSQEAMEARTNPKAYTRNIFAKEVVTQSLEAGAVAGLEAAALTAAVSTVDNIQKVMAGEITAQEAFVDVATDAGVAGGIGTATAFISTAVSQSMVHSSRGLIQSLGNAGVPAAVIAYGVQSYDAVASYAKGEIDGSELAYDLGENMALVAGGAAGAAVAGAIIGSVVPGAGTAAGAAAGAAIATAASGVTAAGLATGAATFVGGMVGTAIAAEAYETAVSLGSEGAAILAEKTQEVAAKTIETAKELVPDIIDAVKTALSEFSVANALPFSLG